MKKMEQKNRQILLLWLFVIGFFLNVLMPLPCQAGWLSTRAVPDNWANCDLGDFQTDFKDHKWWDRPMTAALNAAVNIGEMTFDRVAGGAEGLMIVGGALWLAIFLLKVEGGMMESDPMENLSKIGGMIFKIGIASALLRHRDFFFSYFFTPLIELGAGFVDTATIDGGGGGASYVPEISLDNGLRGAADALKEMASSSHDLAAELQGAGEYIDCLRDIHKLSVFSFEYEFMDWGIAFAGCFIKFGGWLLIVALPFVLMDACIRMGVAAAMCPLFIVAWVFESTRSYAGKGLQAIINVAFTFMMVKIGMLLAVKLMKGAAGIENLSVVEGSGDAANEAIVAKATEVLCQYRMWRFGDSDPCEGLSDQETASIFAFIICTAYGIKLLVSMVDDIANYYAGTTFKNDTTFQAVKAAGNAASQATSMAVNAPGQAVRAARTLGNAGRAIGNAIGNTALGRAVKNSAVGRAVGKLASPFGKEARDRRQQRRQERRQDRQQARGDRIEARQDRRQQRRDDKKQARLDERQQKRDARAASGNSRIGDKLFGKIDSIKQRKLDERAVDRADRAQTRADNLQARQDRKQARREDIKERWKDYFGIPPSSSGSGSGSPSTSSAGKNTSVKNVSGSGNNNTPEAGGAGQPGGNDTSRTGGAGQQDLNKNAERPKNVPPSAQYDAKNKTWTASITNKDGSSRTTVMDEKGILQSVTEKDKNGNVTNATRFDKAGNKTGETKFTRDANGNVTHYDVYDGKGGKLRSVDQTFDSKGNLVGNTSYDAKGSKIDEEAYEWDAQGNMTGSSHTTYDANGSRTDIRDANGNTIQVQEDDRNGNTTALHDANGTHKFTRDENGNVTHADHYDPQGNKTGTTDFSYDKNGELASVIERDGDGDKTREMVNDYDDKGNKTGSIEIMTDKSGKETTQILDANDRVVPENKTVDPSGIASKTNENVVQRKNDVTTETKKDTGDTILKK